MAKVYYVGDWTVLTGPTFWETPFDHAVKGLDIFNYGKWLKDALESDGLHQVQSIPAWDFYKLGPGEYEEILDANDVMIFSDVNAKMFQLAPCFFDRKELGKSVLTFPDRIRLTVEAVQNGKSMMFLGGWLSFTGELGKGGWGRTKLKDILPVQCLAYEDLIESTEGFQAEPTQPGKETFSDIKFDTCPPILGYNQTLQIDDAQTLIKIKGTDDPLLAVRKSGKGRTLAYTSDPAPHWGCNFIFWQQYNEFWLRCLALLLE